MPIDKPHSPSRKSGEFYFATSERNYSDIDNIAERVLRSIAVGRRNWLFTGPKVGGERAAAIYSVIETCKANHVDPQTYIANVTAKIAGNWPASRWDELMPWHWKADSDPQVAQAA